jgi:putative drug exporter of the RND superfamily
MRTHLAARDAPTYIGGPTAVGLDLTNRIAARTPLVVLLTMLTAASVLAIGLRSIVVPIKAVVGTLLSVAATLGIVLRLFPDSEGLPSLEFFVPLFLFVIVFGLSIDYEVFLLNRIAEAVRAGRSNEEAVVAGLVANGRAMTLAGLTLATVFLAFSTSSLASFRQLGAGVAIAIMLDITLVRCVLVPAGVVLLGRWNWWFPFASRAHPSRRRTQL